MELKLNKINYLRDSSSSPTITNYSQNTANLFESFRVSSSIVLDILVKVIKSNELRTSIKKYRKLHSFYLEYIQILFTNEKLPVSNMRRKFLEDKYWSLFLPNPILFRLAEVFRFRNADPDLENELRGKIVDILKMWASLKTQIKKEVDLTTKGINLGGMKIPSNELQDLSKEELSQLVQQISSSSEASLRILGKLKN